MSEAAILFDQIDKLFYTYKIRSGTVCLDDPTLLQLKPLMPRLLFMANINVYSKQHNTGRHKLIFL
jgi:hypothetical protein